MAYGARVGLVLAFFLAIQSSGCSTEECELAAQRCDGRDVLVCVERSCHDSSCSTSEDGKHWKRTSCEHTCVEDEEGAFCALSSSEDRACLRPEHCDDNTAVSCRSGFALERQACEERVCAMTLWGQAICALSSEPNPDCAATLLSAHFCDGAALFDCIGSYVTSTQSCEFGCVMSGEHAAVCADP